MDSWKYNQDYHRVADFLGLDVYDRQDYRLAQKVSYLVDRVRQQDEPMVEAISRLHQVRKKMGINTKGQTLLHQMYEYLRLHENKDFNNESKPKPKLKPKPQLDKSDYSEEIKKSIEESVAKTLGKVLEDENKVQEIIENVLTHEGGQNGT